MVGVGHLAPPAAREDAANEGKVVGRYVHSDHAGESVGSFLLGRLEERGRDRGLTALELTASPNAVGFYERHGYERVAETTHGMTGSVERDVVKMPKTLLGHG